MTIKEIYRKSSETSITSYDFIDTIAGLGYISFYANNGTEKKLNRNTIASQIPANQTTVTQTADTLQVDRHWDLDFNLPAVLANAPLFVEGSFEYTTASNATQYGRMDVVVSKIDNVSGASVLASVSGALVTIGANKTASSRVMTSLTIPKTKMKKGEKLRVNSRFYGWHAAGSDPVMLVWQDGAGRGTTNTNQINPNSVSADLGYKNSTDLIVIIPFELDI